MSDNLRRFHSIKKGLFKLLSTPPTGNRARHFTTLAYLINGVIAGRSCHLPKAASKVADWRKPESRVRCYHRWLNNERIDYTCYYMPFAELLIRCLSVGGKPLVVVFDGSVVGRNCVALVASIVYGKRALPIAWIVRPGGKGHFPEALHLELAQRLHALIPKETGVVFLGDGEFDGTGLISFVKSAGWDFVLRTAKNRLLVENDDVFSPRTVGVSPDGHFKIPDVTIKNGKCAGRMHLVVCNKAGHEKPIFLLTTIEIAQEAVYWYEKRFAVETFFSDQKSRSFQLHKSHIARPERLERIMMATCLAYVWIIFLGALALEKGWNRKIHRNNRCDLGLFQLGLRVMEDRLNKNKFIPMQLNLFRKFVKSVR